MNEPFIRQRGAQLFTTSIDVAERQGSKNEPPKELLQEELARRMKEAIRRGNKKMVKELARAYNERRAA